MAAATGALRFWGVRGTIPTPSDDPPAYGGNTSCLAADLGEHGHLILDCGSGVRLLGNRLAAEQVDGERRFHIFFSHYHFDHVEGLPVFPPLYDAASRITIYGFEPGGQPLSSVFETLIRPPYFPVTFADVPSRIDYVPMGGAPVTIGDVTIHCLPLNHPDGCLAYRLERGDRRVVYATDHEHGDEAIDRALVAFAKGADCLIYDATYMHSEYEKLRRGWGHSTWYAAVQTAIAASVETLVLFHHHPDHGDAELERILEVARGEFPRTELAREGAEIAL